MRHLFLTQSHSGYPLPGSTGQWSSIQHAVLLSPGLVCAFYSSLSSMERETGVNYFHRMYSVLAINCNSTTWLIYLCTLELPCQQPSHRLSSTNHSIQHTVPLFIVLKSSTAIVLLSVFNRVQKIRQGNAMALLFIFTQLTHRAYEFMYSTLIQAGTLMSRGSGFIY